MAGTNPVGNMNASKGRRLITGAPPGLVRQSGHADTHKGGQHKQQKATGKTGFSRSGQYRPPASASQSTDSQDGPTGKLDMMAERLRFIATVMVGYRVEVQVKSGLVYSGILHTVTFDSKDFHVVLLMAEIVKSINKNDPVQKPIKKLVVHAKDVVQVVAKDLKTSAQDVGPRSVEEDAGGFGTDSSISRGKATGFGRELQRWTPDEEPGSLTLTSDTIGKWDQFAAFERMTGATTTFTEEQYTTALNKSDPKMKAIEARATRLAKEIEGQSSTNFHMAEERGHAFDDSGMDEEDKYSGVVRSSDAKYTAGGRHSGNQKAIRNDAPVHVGKKDNVPIQEPSRMTPGAEGAASSDNKGMKEEKGASTEGTEKPKLGLNPNAKPFQFNANAKEFVPGGRKAAPAFGGGYTSGFAGATGQPQMMGGYMPNHMAANMYRSNQYAGQQVMYPQAYHPGMQYYHPGMQRPE